MKPKKKRVYERMGSLESWLRLCTDDWKSKYSALLKRCGYPNRAKFHKAAGR